MDSTIIAACAAAAGSVVGATATIAATWITQRTQSTHALLQASLHERETLYGEFITEASRLAVEGLTHSLERPETFVKLYGILGRIRLLATEPVLDAAETCCRQIVEVYSKPNMTIEQIRGVIEQDQVDPVRDFSTACRKELCEIKQTG
jgi:hypothetical protein